MSGQYSLKYPKVDVETLRRVIIPEAADYCARERAKNLWTPKQYRECLKRKIRELIKQHAGE